MKAGVYLLHFREAAKFMELKDNDIAIIHTEHAPSINRGDKRLLWEVHPQADGSYKLKAPNGKWLYVVKHILNARLHTRLTDSGLNKWDIHDAEKGSYLILHGTTDAATLHSGHTTSNTEVRLDPLDVQRQKQTVEFIWHGPLPDETGTSTNPTTSGTANGYTSPWVTPGRYVLRNCYSGTVLDLRSGSNAEGSPVTAWQVQQTGPQYTSPSQQWDVIAGKDGFQLRNVASGTYLGRPSNQVSMGVPVQGTSYKGEWGIKKADECFVLELADTLYVLDLAAGNTNDDAPVLLWNLNYGRNQQWEFLKV